jgi:hypothetical protein
MDITRKSGHSSRVPNRAQAAAFAADAAAQPRPCSFRTSTPGTHGDCPGCRQRSAAGRSGGHWPQASRIGAAWPCPRAPVQEHVLGPLDSLRHVPRRTAGSPARCGGPGCRAGAPQTRWPCSAPRCPPTPGPHPASAERAAGSSGPPPRPHLATRNRGRGHAVHVLGRERKRPGPVPGARRADGPLVTARRSTGSATGRRPRRSPRGAVVIPNPPLCNPHALRPAPWRRTTRSTPTA